MASTPKDKLEADAQRAKSRSFPGYLKDRLSGSADFEKARTAKDSSAGVLGNKNPANKEAMEAAGFRKGGSVKAKCSTHW